MKRLITFLAVCVLWMIASANDVGLGLYYPSSYGAYYNTWTNPGNVYSCNSTYATVIASSGTGTMRQSWEDFAVATIPGKYEITGIAVTVEHYVSVLVAGQQAGVYLYNSSSASWTSVKALTLSATEVSQTVGGASDLWGKTWTLDDFTDANFSVQIAYGNTSATPRQFNVDCISLSVYCFFMFADIDGIQYHVTIDGISVNTLNSIDGISD